MVELSVSVKIPILSSIAGIPATFLVTSTTIDIDWDSKNHARWVEVHFQDSSNQDERIRVWIEDLGNLSKYSYFKKDGSPGKWVSYRYLRTSDSDGKKYSLLANIAATFLLNQHKLNILKGIFINDGKNSLKLTSLCPQGCDGRSVCNWNDLEIKHKDFFNKLRNLDSAWTGNYWSPVTAYIKLKDLQFSSLNTKQEDKEMYGSMVYGLVDYDYKATPSSKYFANYSNKFSLSVGDDGNLKKGVRENDLVVVSFKLKHWKTMYSEHPTFSRQCCCNKNDNSFECLLGSNFVKEYNSSDLGTIKSNVTSNSDECVSR